MAVAISGYVNFLQYWRDITEVSYNDSSQIFDTWMTFEKFDVQMEQKKIMVSFY